MNDNTTPAPDPQINPPRLSMVLLILIGAATVAGLIGAWVLHYQSNQIEPVAQEQIVCEEMPAVGPTQIPCSPGVVDQVVEAPVEPPAAVVEPEVAAGPTDEAIAYGLADRALRLLLQNPDSIEFQGVHYVASSQSVCGEVRSLAVTGAMTAWMPFYYDIESGHLSLFARPATTAEEARASVLIGAEVGCTVGTLGQR